MYAAGSGGSPDDPLLLKFAAVGDSATNAKGASTSSDQDVIFFPIINSTTPSYLPGSYGRIYTTTVNGTLYECTDVYPLQSYTPFEGAIVGDNGKQYIGCAKAPSEFEANFYLDSNSASEVEDDLSSNIKVVAPLCTDKDCGDLAEPIDMARLRSAYIPESSAKLDQQLITWLVRETSRRALLDDNQRQDAYELMLTELFTQLYLWKDYQNEIENVTGQNVGIPGLVNEIADVAEASFPIMDGSRILIEFRPELIALIKTKVLDWSKYATNKNTLGAIDPYLDGLQIAAGVGIAIERAAFEFSVYQALGSCYTREYIETFESEIIPSVKDPVLKTAFANVKTKLLGSDPSGKGGLLYDKMAALSKVVADAAFASGYAAFQVVAQNAISGGLIATGVGAAGAAVLGIPPAAIPLTIALIVISYVDDELRFDLERKIVTALATFIHNNYPDIGDVDESCPTTDDGWSDVMLAEKMFYAARLYFDLLKNSYDRWLISGQLLGQDLAQGTAQGIAGLVGLEEEGYLWEAPRSEYLSQKEVKYAAKTIKAMAVVFKCDGCESGYPSIPDPIPPPPPPPQPSNNGVSTAHFTLDCSAVADACTDNWKNNTWSPLLTKFETIYTQYPSKFGAHYTFNVTTDSFAQACSAQQVNGNANGDDDIRIMISSGTQITTVLSDELSFVACHELAHRISVHGASGLSFDVGSNEQLADWFAYTICGYKSEAINSFESLSDKTIYCEVDPRNDVTNDGTYCKTNCAACCFNSNGECRGMLAAYWKHLLSDLAEYDGARLLCGTDFDNCNFFAKATEYNGSTYSVDLSQWRQANLNCSSCSNECAQGQTKCVSGKLYDCVTDADNCWKWNSGTVCPTGACAVDGLKCGNCTPNHHNACYSNDIYSYDSCNALQSLVQDCGESGFNQSAPLTCQSGHLYQQYITKGCTNASCTQSTGSQKKQDCGTASCQGTSCCTGNSTYKCSGSDLYWYSSCNVKQSIKNSCGTAGCSGTACCQSHTSTQCSNNDVYWYSSCNAMQDLKEDCGTNTTGTNYCDGNSVYRDDIIKGCSSGACTSNQQKVLVEDCGVKKQCGGGQCKCTMSVPWPNNTLTITTVGSSKQLSWSNPSPNWVDKYVIARAPGATTPPPGLSIGSTTGTSFTDSSGTKGQCYNYVVYAFDACNQSRNSSTMVNACW
ncbi:MAG: Ig domain-containing protein [bacterium]